MVCASGRAPFFDAEGRLPQLVENACAREFESLQVVEQQKSWVHRPAFLRRIDPQRVFVVFAAPWPRQEGGKARRSSPSLARPITAKLDARRDAGETLDKVASLSDLVKAFS
jgi:hypothetical protein